MKLHILALVFLLGAAAFAALPQGHGEPLTRTQVLDLVKFGMDSSELVQKITDNGIAFEPTDDDLLALRAAGAKPEVTQAVIASSTAGREGGPPLSKEQIIRLVTWGLPDTAIAARIEKRGVDFDATDQAFAALRGAGVHEAVMQAIQAVKPRPLSRDQVGALVAGGVPSERAVELVKQRGIDFLADDDYLQALRLAGADDAVIQAVREASASAKAGLKVDTLPYSEVILDGVSQGHADAWGEIVIKAKAGEHALKVTLPQRKDFEQSVKIIPPQVTEVAARLEVLPAPVRVNPRDGLNYVFIPAGTFVMGCSPGDLQCGPEEKPAHPVTFSQGFWLGQTPATVGAYRRFLEATQRLMPNHNHVDNAAVVEVTWDDASAYCAWIGGRLPTEAEWEYAARGGTTDPRYGSPVADILRFAPFPGLERQVAQLPPNGFGLYDMLGYVWQWVHDWYSPTYYQSSPPQDPQGPAGGLAHVLRGGSKYEGVNSARVSSRRWSAKVFATSFRCASAAASF